MVITSKWFALFAVAAVGLVAGCDDQGGSTPSAGTGGSAPSAATVYLNGAGATFPEPLYKRWVTEYDSVAANVKLDYTGIGSGGGIRSITDKAVHFAGSDAPLKGKEIEKMGGAAAIVEFPSVAGSVVIIYNLPGLSGELKLTGDLVSEVYLGHVTRWNDAKIASLNPGVDLPDLAITPAYRTDGSGTTFVFTSYVCTQSDAFKSTVGAGKQVQWPAGQGGKGNQGVTQAVQQTTGGIGYVEYAYAEQNNLPTAAIQNRAGKFLKASPESVAAAGAGASGSMTGSLLAANIWDQPGADSYPIAAFTYMIAYSDLNNLPDKASAQALVDFFWWATHDGQKFAAQMNYAPLAGPVQARIEALLKTLTYKGEPLSAGSSASHDG